MLAALAIESTQAVSMTGPVLTVLQPVPEQLATGVTGQIVAV